MKYLIWSHEHMAWWAPNGHGYVNRVSQAGIYDKVTAENVCTNANRYLPEGQGPNEVCIPLEAIAIDGLVLAQASALLQEAIALPFSDDKKAWDDWCAQWRPRAEAVIEAAK